MPDQARQDVGAVPSGWMPDQVRQDVVAGPPGWMPDQVRHDVGAAEVIRTDARKGAPEARGVHPGRCRNGGMDS